MDRTLVAITGASSGIGAAFARRLAPGHDLLLIARRTDRMEDLARELSDSHGTHVETLTADLTREDDLARAADRIEHHPHLALLINNAGFGTRGRFWEASLASQIEMHKLHVLATVQLTHAALRNMIPRDSGGIVNVASVSAFVRTPGTVSYAATKTWMTTFTEGLYLELRAIRSHLVVQALCPGFTYSEFHDKMGVHRNVFASSAFWLTAEQVVEASLDGLRNRRLFVIPGWRYRLLAGILSKLPTPLRLAVESATGRARAARNLVSGDNPPQIASGT